MPTNHFQGIAIGGGANVMDQSDYEANSQVAAGNTANTVANSPLVNKMLRQPSLMAEAIGDMIVGQLAQDCVDDGTTATLVTQLLAVIAQQALASLNATTAAGVVSLTNILTKGERGVTQTLAAAATLHVDWELGSVVVINQATACAVVWDNKPAAGSNAVMILVRIHDDSGDTYAFTLPGTVKWLGGNVPVWTQVANGVDVCTVLAFGGSFELATPGLAFS